MGTRATSVILLVFIAAGCSDNEPRRFRVSGNATVAGQPIPYGEVLFTPDGSKQNSGPQGIATIIDGKFDTQGPSGKGIAGGPTVVRVTGLTGQAGKLLCEHDLTIDLPRADSTQDFDVPERAKATGRPRPDI